jgi:hypothetical protein
VVNGLWKYLSAKLLHDLVVGGKSVMFQTRRRRPEMAR